VGHKFQINQLQESYEIQKSYDNGDYVETVLKCRIYLESWLFEYVFAILHPMRTSATDANRLLVKQSFDDMFIQLNWLKQYKHISKADCNRLNEIRIFSDRVLHNNEVIKSVMQEELELMIESAVHYCYKLTLLTQRTIEKTVEEYQL